MINLVIDIGNTFSKVALFNSREIIKVSSFDSLTPAVIKEFSAGYAIDNAIVSAVKPVSDELVQFLESNYSFFNFNTHHRRFINILYKTPQTLGLDRFAAVIGAATAFPRTNCLVIDAGTCITYDFVDQERNYYGGSISPGIDMRYKAMHTFTGKLPSVEFYPGYDAYQGDDTRTSMISGVQNGIVYEVEGFIRTYSSLYPDLSVLLCGGNAKFFATQLKNSIFAQLVKVVPNLVLIGLNEVIYQHND